MYNKHYSEIPSSWRSYEQIASELHLTDEDIKNKIIVDIGSGGSDFAAQINNRPELASRTLSIDPNFNLGVLSGDNKDLMKDAVAEIKQNQLDAVAGLSEELPIKDECVDLIISNHAIPWHISDNPEKVARSIEEMLRILKPGGEIRLNPIDDEIFTMVKNTVDKYDEVEISRHGELIKIKK
ncbi:class I SAM-dependent methyltransferase [Patescibacteria group bacterium AH-259-L07]|nr:class I SAM-dependent methyltransferase [Patescibacteria group bacterium AH-259-L07]